MKELKKKTVKYKNKIIVAALFTVYLVVLGYLLFLSEEMGRTAGQTDYRYNFKPFKEIMRYISRYRSFGFLRVFINLAGNILAFIPFGLFLPVLLRGKRKGFFTIFISGIFFTLMIETTQLFTRVGSCDVDDLILNNTGVMIGYVCYKLITAYRKKGQKKRYHRSDI